MREWRTPHLSVKDLGPSLIMRLGPHTFQRLRPQFWPTSVRPSSRTGEALPDLRQG